MKKQIKIFTLIAILVLMSFTVSVASNAAVGDYFYKSYNVVDEEFRAVWVTTADNIDMPKQDGTSAEAIQEWKDFYLSVLDTAELYNINAIIFQVRPNNDAFYPSLYNPWSRYLVGYGQDPGWDPLEWMVEVTHARGMEYHAWLNPYRTSGTVSSSAILEGVDTDSPKVKEYDDALVQADKATYFSSLKASAGKNYEGNDYSNPIFATGDDLNDNVVLGTENKYILNPANPEVITHIENTVREIVENYEVDAIHFDDYFYPNDCQYSSSGSNTNYKNRAFSVEPYIEKADYEKYTGKNYDTSSHLEVYNWRRNNVDTLIKNLNDILVEVNATREIPCVLGIAPTGNWAPSVESCAETTVWERGAEGGMENAVCGGYYAYSDLYADTYKWVKEGWIDYMLPQAYSDGATYSSTVSWWSNAIKDTNCKLYIGCGIYKLNDEFNSTTIFGEQIETNQKYKYNIDGYSIFTYRNFLSGNSKTQMNMLKAYMWKTNALTPTYSKYASMYNATVSDNAEVTKIEEVTNNKIHIEYTEVSDAKAYALYKFDSSVTDFASNLTADKIVQMNLKGKTYFEIASIDESAKYVIVTYSQNNTAYSDYNVIDFSKTIYNVAPVIEMTSTMPDEVVAHRSVNLVFNVTDDNNDVMTYKLYTVYGSRETEILSGEITNYKLEYTWFETYNYPTNGLKFKLVVTDGKDETVYITSSFNIVTACTAHNYSDATCVNPQICTKCGSTTGSALGHSIAGATCTEDGTCSICNTKITNSALGHNWAEATKKAPKTCTVCGATEGEKLKGCSCASGTLIAFLSLLSAGVLIIFRHKR